MSLLGHLLGGAAVALDVVSLWLLGDRRSWRRRRAGMLGMSGVNALFVVQAALVSNWTLLVVSGLSCGLQLRAVKNWTGGSV